MDGVEGTQPGDRPRVLIADDTAIARTLLRAYLDEDFEVVGEASDGDEAVRLARQLTPDLVLMDVEMPGMSGIEATREIRASAPSVNVVILSAHENRELLRAAMVAGARDYLEKPVEADELVEVLKRVVQDVRALTQAAEEQEQTPGAGTWSFCAAGTGDGRTTLALAMAAELARIGRRVVYVDLDLLFGDAAFYLRIKPPQDDLCALLQHDQPTPPDHLEAHLTEAPGGFDLLLPSTDPVDAYRCVGCSFVPVLRWLEAIYDHVLVDLAPGLPEEQLAVLDVSRYVFPVARGTSARLKTLRQIVSIFEGVGYTHERVRPLVVDDVRGRSLDFLEPLGLDVARIFPFDEAVDEAVRAALPLPLHAPSCPLARAVRQFLVRHLEVAPPNEVGEERSLLARLFG